MIELSNRYRITVCVIFKLNSYTKKDMKVNIEKPIANEITKSFLFFKNLLFTTLPGI